MVIYLGVMMTATVSVHSVRCCRIKRVVHDCFVVLVPAAWFLVVLHHVVMMVRMGIVAHTCLVSRLRLVLTRVPHAICISR